MRRDREQFNDLIQLKKERYYVKKKKRTRAVAAVCSACCCVALAILVWPSITGQTMTYPKNSQYEDAYKASDSQPEVQTAGSGLVEFSRSVDQKGFALVGQPGKSALLFSAEAGTGTEYSKLCRWLADLKLDRTAETPGLSGAVYAVTFEGSIEYSLYVGEDCIYNDNGECYALTQSEMASFLELTAEATK